MRKARQSDRNLVVKILSDSFIDNKSVNYVFKSTGKKSKKITNLMRYSFDLGLKMGDIFINNDNNACAIIMFPYRKKLSIWGIIQDLKLVIKVIGLKNLLSVFKKEKDVSSNHPQNDFAHLWYIGVDSKYQGKGIGSIFLKEIISHYRKDKLSMFLETSTKNNIPFYEKNQFNVFKVINEYGFEFYFLKN